MNLTEKRLQLLEELAKIENQIAKGDVMETKDIKAKKLGNSVKGPEPEYDDQFHKFWTRLPKPRIVANNGWQIQFPDQPLVFKDKKLAFRIVEAVNSHEALLSGARCALKELNKMGATCQNIERAIAQAEGK